jgi:Flp pilus assembly protein TadG
VSTAPLRQLHRWRGSDRQSGAAAVELALVLPILLLLVFGIIDFGRAYNAKISLAQAAREGARVASLRADVNGDGVSDGKDVASRVDQAKGGLAVNPPSINSACSGSSGASDVASVTVSYTFTYATPIGVLAGFAAGPITLSGTGVMRCLG